MKTCIIYGCTNQTKSKMCESCYKKAMKAREESFDMIQKYLKERSKNDSKRIN